MAEIFGAVASGAGLASLAIQLVDSAQKLKALYNASKDAPATVAELCFELETMSLSLRQLDSHRNASITGDELLGRCYTTCIRMVGKIEDAVIKIERLIQRRRMVGRLYMAFKEPEIRELLEELERSKSSMSFAYMSYCQYVTASEHYCRDRLADVAKLLEPPRGREESYPTDCTEQRNIFSNHAVT
jgi:hypothetical protein